MEGPRARVPAEQDPRLGSGHHRSRVDSPFENRPVSLISRLRLAASLMRADRRAEGACHRLASPWWTLILAGLVVLSAPFVATFLQRATSPPLVPSSPYRVPATNPAFLLSVIGPFTENRGQVRDGDVRYTYAAGGLRVGMVPSGLLIGILDERAGTSAASSNSPANSAPEDGGDATVTGASVVRIGFDGSNRVAPRGREELHIQSNYVADDDSSNWRVG